MLAARNECPQLFRVWIARYEDWQPRRWDEVPPVARAVELAVPECLPRDAAAHVIEGFNAAMLCDADKRWAVAVAVAVRYEGDLTPGEVVTACRLGQRAPET